MAEEEETSTCTTGFTCLENTRGVHYRAEGMMDDRIRNSVILPKLSELNIKEARDVHFPLDLEVFSIQKTFASLFAFPCLKRNMLVVHQRVILLSFPVFEVLDFDRRKSQMSFDLIFLLYLIIPFLSLRGVSSEGDDSREDYVDELHVQLTCQERCQGLGNVSIVFVERRTFL